MPPDRDHDHDDDARDLARLGYRQRLDRALGSFSSFAAGFSYLSILTGLPQLFYMGYAAGGPAFFWTWPAVLGGQFLVAACFAEMASEFPLSGGVYPWSRRLGPSAIGWFAGWIYLGCAVVTLASVALALQPIVARLGPPGSALGPPGDPRGAVLLGLGLIALSTAINAVGVRLLARINNVGVIAELIGAATLAALLFGHARRGPGVVLARLGRGDGGLAAGFGAATAAALTSAFVLYGFDTAGSLAEETADPRRKAPRAILAALGAAGLAGLVLIVGTLMAAPDPMASELGQAGGGMPGVVRAVLGPGLGTVLLADMALAIVVCTLTVHAAAVRLVFAMARDGALPGSASLARVAATSRTPTRPALLIGGLAAAALAADFDDPKIVAAMASVAVVWANLAYLLVTIPQLARRLDPRRRGVAPGPFRLGRWGMPINALAVAWGLALVINIAWPRPEVYGAAWPRRFLAPLATAALLLAGLACRAAVRRGPGVLDEHRAPADPID